jgi:hypothetical protein
VTTSLPASLAAEIEIAKVLAASDLLPTHLRNKPANIVLVGQIARSLHLDTITALTQVAVVDGKPTLGAALQAALVRRAGHRLHIEVDETTMIATATLVRSDDPDTKHVARWDQAKAVTAGLWGKGAWSKYPGAMLANRAITEVVRMAASDVLMGAVYDEDELRPAIDDDQAPAPAPAVERPAVEAPTVDLDDEDIVDVTDADIIEVDE